MPKMFVPSIKTMIRLLSDWKFPCFNEHRNHVFIQKMRPETKGASVDSVMITLPKDTVLRIDRIYIRSGKSQFDSITFTVVSHPSQESHKGSFGKIGVGRFWAKLTNINEIEYEIETQSIPEKRGKKASKA